MAFLKKENALGEKMTKSEMTERQLKGEFAIGMFGEDPQIPIMVILGLDEFYWVTLKNKLPCKKRFKTKRSADLVEDDEDDIVAMPGYIFCDAEYKGQEVHNMIQCMNCSLIGSHKDEPKTNVQYHIRYGNYREDVKHMEDCVKKISTCKPENGDKSEESVKEKPKRKGIFASIKEDAQKSLEEENTILKEKADKSIPGSDILDVPDVSAPDVSAPDVKTPTVNVDKGNTPSDSEMEKLLEEYLKRKLEKQ